MVRQGPASVDGAREPCLVERSANVVWLREFSKSSRAESLEVKVVDTVPSQAETWLTWRWDALRCRLTDACKVSRRRR